MEGRGWLVIYGVLFLVVLFLFFSQLSVNGRVDQLQAEVASLRTAAPSATPQVLGIPQATSSANPFVSDGPDLSTGESRDRKRKEDLDAIKESLLAYQTEKKLLPSSLSVLESVPTDPLSPKYGYRYTKTGSAGFRLTCYLENRNDPDDSKDGKKDQIYTLTEK